MFRQEREVEGLAEVASPQWAGGAVEDGEDARVVRMFGQLQPSCWAGCLGRDSVGKAGDGLAGDGEVFQTQFGLTELGLKGVDLGAEIVGQGPGGVLLKVKSLEEGLRFTRRPSADRAR